MDRKVPCGLEKCVFRWYWMERSADVSCLWLTDGTAELHYALTDLPAAECVRFRQGGVSVQLRGRDVQPTLRRYPRWPMPSAMLASRARSTETCSSSRGIKPLSSGNALLCPRTLSLL